MFYKNYSNEKKLSVIVLKCRSMNECLYRFFDEFLKDWYNCTNIKSIRKSEVFPSKENQKLSWEVNNFADSVLTIGILFRVFFDFL